MRRGAGVSAGPRAGWRRREETREICGGNSMLHTTGGDACASMQ